MHKLALKLKILSILLFLAAFNCAAQQPALVISSIFPNPSGSVDGNLEFVELTATRSVNFATTPYSVIFGDGGNATAANGWITGGNGSYAINVSTGTVVAGDKIYVGGNAIVVNGATCKIYSKDMSGVGDGGIGTGNANGVVGNGGGTADGVAVFSTAASAVTNASIPIDAIFWGTGVGSASGKFIVPTNDKYNNAQGKFGIGTNTFVAPDPGGGDNIVGTGEFNPSTSLWTAGRSFSISASVPNCNAPSTVLVQVPNSLLFEVNSSLTTPYLLPPTVSGVVSNPTDPASTLGIVFNVKDNGTDIPAASYDITASSSNTAVVSNANVVVTKSNGSANIKVTPSAVGYTFITLTLNKAGVTKNYIISYAASAMGTNSTSNTNYHTGYSDASATIALDDDYLFTADDENNKFLVYHRKNSGLYVKSFDYSTWLNLTDLSGGLPREIDLEGSARGISNPNRIFWIGSMSNKSSEAPFDPRPNRDRIFATTISGTGAATTATYAGHYTGMRNAVMAWGDANGLALSSSGAPGMDPKLIDGLNVEGLSFGPDNSTLYIGFRAPLVPIANRTKALIAPVLNFETWFNNGAPAGAPSFGSPIMLELNGYGIRSIDKISTSKYVIIAGNWDDGSFQGAIFLWNGNAADAPVIQPGFNISGMNPESFLQVNMGGNIMSDRLQIISDNGAFIYYNDNIAAKDLGNNNWKKFRSDIVINPSNVLPVIFEKFDLQIVNTNDVKVYWTCKNIHEAKTFEVQRSNGGSSFITVTSLPAESNVHAYSFTDTDLSNGNYEYRIKVVQLNGAIYYTTIKAATIKKNIRYALVQPNPIENNTINLFFSTAGNKTINVTNDEGKLIYHTLTAAMNTSVVIPQLSKGVYTVTVTGKDFVENLRIMK